MNKHTISRLDFESQFADKLAGFITEKFDKFVMPHKFNADMITKEIFESWTAKRIHERDKTCENRRNTFKQFRQQVVWTGDDSYVPPAMARYRTDKEYHPHIFTNYEVQHFLDSIYNMKGSERRRTVFSFFSKYLSAQGCVLEKP